MTNRRADGTPCWWTTTEDRLLREVYPTQGPAAAAALLPGRTLRAIRVHAASLGLKAPRRSLKGLPRKVYLDTPETDAALRQGLQACTKPTHAADLAASMGRSMEWLRRRSRQLGLQIPKRPERPWLPAETAILRECAHLPAPELARVLRRAGYIRTPCAVALRCRQQKLDRTCPHSHTLPDVAMLLGVSPQTVLVWTQQHGLRTSKRQPDTGGAGQRNRVHRKDLRAWIRDNPTRINLAKVDGPWFLDLVLGAAT
jgi:hypothetical protein